MNDQHSPSQGLTPSQLAAHGRSQAAEHGGNLTPSQLARDNQIMPHGHEPEHGRETELTAEKPKGMGYAEWIELTRNKAGGNSGSDAYNRERERILPEEERTVETDKDKGRGR